MGKNLRETLVGVFVVISIIIFIVLYAWLSGRVGLRNTYDVTVYFDDVTGLRVGDPVMIYGLEKGKVKALELGKKGVATILALDRDIKLPEDSRIIIQSVSYLGSDRYVRIFPGKEQNQSTVFNGANQTIDLESMASNINSLVTMLRNVNLPDFDVVATDLMTELNRTTRRIADMVKGPTTRIESLAVRLDSLSMLIEGDGTLGRLLKSDELYEEVRETNQALRDLIVDIKENPKRYINIKVF
jgi:ABC-type transporter Mla subunit MlaD